MKFQSDNSMYCIIPDPFPSTAFGKWSATPDYLIGRTKTILHVLFVVKKATKVQIVQKKSEQNYSRGRGI